MRSYSTCLFLCVLTETVIYFPTAMCFPSLGGRNRTRNYTLTSPGTPSSPQPCAGSPDHSPTLPLLPFLSNKLHYQRLHQWQALEPATSKTETVCLPRGLYGTCSALFSASVQRSQLPAQKWCVPPRRGSRLPPCHTPW